MDTPEFDRLVSGRWPDLELASRPARSRCSDARVLYPDTAIAVLCEPRICQQLSRQWHDQDTVRSLDGALHSRELERAAVPPVIEVTVTAPPGGITRTELGHLVRDQLAQLASQAQGCPPGDPPAGPSDIPPVGAVSEDITTTGPIPVIREVRVP